jgi:hypothetical protein
MVNRDCLLKGSSTSDNPRSSWRKRTAYPHETDMAYIQGQSLRMTRRTGNRHNKSFKPEVTTTYSSTQHWLVWRSRNDLESSSELNLDTSSVLPVVRWHCFINILDDYNFLEHDTSAAVFRLSTYISIRDVHLSGFCYAPDKFWNKYPAYFTGCRLIKPAQNLISPLIFPDLIMSCKYILFFSFGATAPPPPQWGPGPPHSRGF